MAEFDLNETMYVSKSLLGVEDVTRGFGRESQVRAGEPTQITQVNASHFRGVMTFPTLKDLQDVDTKNLGDNAAAAVKETGQIYFWSGNAWITSSNLPVKVDTIDALTNLSKDIAMAYVSDINRGGFFLFKKEFESVNDGGTVINGWVRQFSGICDVKWFGALGDGQTDDSAALQAAFSSSLPIELTKGTYFTSQGLTLRNGGYLCGNRSGTLKFEDDIICLTLESDTLVENVKFEGKRTMNSQIAISVNGGNSYTLVSNTMVRGCYFNNIGGSAYKLEKVTSLANQFCENVIKNSRVGIELSVNGGGAMISNCVISFCDVGLTSQGFEAQIVNCKLLDNGVSCKLVGGNTTSNGIKFTNCSIQSSGAAALLCNGVNYDNAMFLQTRISGVMTFESSNKISFLYCDLSGNTINFTNSNENKFISCDVNGINVQNNGTCNYFTNSITNDTVLNAGFVEATLVNSDIALQSNNTSTLIKFDTVSQILPFNENFSKYKIYDATSGLFDFTKVVSPNHKDFVMANISVCVNASDAGLISGTRMYLYKVSSADQEITQNIAMEDIVATLQAEGSAGMGRYSQFVFSGLIPRGKYKLVCRTNQSGKQVLKNGNNFIGTGKTITRARIYGI